VYGSEAIFVLATWPYVFAIPSSGVPRHLVTSYGGNKRSCLVWSCDEPIQLETIWIGH
jgi:hypothetical protein